MQQQSGEPSPAVAMVRLRDEMLALAGQLKAASSATTQTFTGKDDTGSVRVTLDPAGRPGEVVVTAGWRDSAAGRDGLAEAVRQAWRAAVSARLTAWSEAVEKTSPPAPTVGVEQSASTDLPVDAVPGDPLDYRAQSNLSGLTSLLADAEAALDELSAISAVGKPATAEGHSPGREVTVTIADGELIELRPESRWLADAAPATIGRMIHAALVDAYRNLDQSQVRAQPAALRELVELTNDPVALMRTVGLLRD
ncbi:hypothetical protein ACWDV4_21385 [Micromonospora sp. NPDC003197]